MANCCHQSHDQIDRRSEGPRERQEQKGTPQQIDCGNIESPKDHRGRTIITGGLTRTGGEYGITAPNKGHGARLVKIAFPPLRASRKCGIPSNSFGSSWSVHTKTRAGPDQSAANVWGVSNTWGASGNFSPNQRLPLGSCNTRSGMCV